MGLTWVLYSADNKNVTESIIHIISINKPSPRNYAVKDLFMAMSPKPIGGVSRSMLCFTTRNSFSPHAK